MPLAEASSMMLISPLIVTALAMAILKEPVGAKRWVSIFIGFFGAFWYAFDLSKTIDIKSLSARNFYFGYKVKFNLSKLYTESMYGGTVDFGIIKKMSNNLSVGFVTKNLGKEYYNNTSFNTDMTIGLGASYKLKIPIKILSDILYVDSDVMTKLSLITEFPYVNVVPVKGSFIKISFEFILCLAHSFIFSFSFFNPS